MSSSDALDEFKCQLRKLLSLHNGKVEEERLQALYTKKYRTSIVVSKYGANSIQELLTLCRDTITSARFHNPKTNSSDLCLLLRASSSVSSRRTISNSLTSKSYQELPSSLVSTAIGRPRAGQHPITTAGARSLIQMTTLKCLACKMNSYALTMLRPFRLLMGWLSQRRYQSLEVGGATPTNALVVLVLLLAADETFRLLFNCRILPPVSLPAPSYLRSVMQRACQLLQLCKVPRKELRWCATRACR